MLATTINFPLPLPELRLLWLLDFSLFVLEGLITISSSVIKTCSLGSLEKKPAPSLTNDCRKLTFISLIQTDSIGPCKANRGRRISVFHIIMLTLMTTDIKKEKETSKRKEPSWTSPQYRVNISIHLLEMWQKLQLSDLIAKLLIWKQTYMIEEE